VSSALWLSVQPLLSMAPRNINCGVPIKTRRFPGVVNRQPPQHCQQQGSMCSKVNAGDPYIDQVRVNHQPPENIWWNMHVLGHHLNVLTGSVPPYMWKLNVVCKMLYAQVPGNTTLPRNLAQIAGTLTNLTKLAINLHWMNRQRESLHYIKRTIIGIGHYTSLHRARNLMHGSPSTTPTNTSLGRSLRYNTA